jgi:L-ascorbate metabolism protein UlaG (beta-lactamase superfamily)
MRLTWHGHAFFEVETQQGKRIVIDPFTDNPLTKCRPEDLEADLVLVTHGHFDHAGCVTELKAPVLAIFEIATWLERKGREATGMNIGGSYRLGDVRITMTPAMHSGGLPEEEGPTLGNGGASTGFMIDDGRTRFYHAGDTGLFGDMKHVIGEVMKPDVAALPIGDLFTMGPEHAGVAAKWLGVKTAIPMHYSTFPPIQQDPQDFVRAVAGACDVKIMEPDSTIEV